MGLSAYYNFNQGSAGGENAGVTTWNDLTSNNFDGVLSGFALMGNTSNWVAPGPSLNGTGNCCPNTQMLSGIISSSTYQAAMDLTSDGTVPSGNMVVLKAGNNIEFQPNFNVQHGAILEEVIEGCGSMP